MADVAQLVERRFRKAQVVSSSLTIGSRKDNHLKYMNKSRLNRNLEKQSEKTIFLSVVGSIILISVIVFYGLPMLIKFSLLLEKNNQSNVQVASSNSLDYIAPPFINPGSQATNSANITVSGTAKKNESIELYVNNNLTDKTIVNDKGNFSFSSVNLQTGENTITTKAATGGKESDFSNSINIIYNNKPPQLSIDSPSDNQTFSGGNNQQITVTGKTDTDASVTVNGFWAVIDSSGKYSYSLKLQSGDNQIKVDALDSAGNKTEMERKVTYNQ